MNFAENIRLVIWDLDETFWSGTLTEGGYSVNRENIEIVRLLASRGIMSSICSKNNFEQVKQILESLEIWDYFIFPSINWEPKGPRLAKLVENVQLRAETILFIDDNPMNLHEVKHFVKGINIADEKIIPSLLDSKNLQGKSDLDLSRLKQYKLLETKKIDEGKLGDNEDFLRASQIRVYISNPLDNIDRAIEIINRTNQLNFTKNRLSEDLSEARTSLHNMLSMDHIEAGIIHVVDKYGDYGEVGLYVIDNSESRASLIHFCFSCRTLNMGIELWAYQYIGMPAVDIVGEVLSDIVNDHRVIDWIELVSEENLASELTERKYFNKIIFRGGCEQRSFSHFFTNLADDVIGEFNFQRHGLSYRIDHSCFFRYAAEGVRDDQLESLQDVGFVKDDLTSALFQESDGKNLAVLSFWTDARGKILKAKDTGVFAPLVFGKGVVAESNDEIRIFDLINKEFEISDLTSEEDFKKNINIGLSKIPKNTKIAIVLARELDYPDGKNSILPRTRMVNQWIRDVVAKFEEILVFDVADYVFSDGEVLTNTHFEKIVYFRMFKDFIARLIAEDESKSLNNLDAFNYSSAKSNLDIISLLYQSGENTSIFEMAEKTSPEKFEIKTLFQIGLAYKKTGKYEEALHYFKLCVDRDVKYATALKNAMLMSRKLNKLEDFQHYRQMGTSN